jgi:isoleucyl-tRNA synthetase
VRLSELINQVTYAAEEYKLDRATRPISEFIDDLSTWYIRRSRDRFKKGNKKDVCDALATTHFVLVELSKIIAPFTPFIADEIYRKLHVVDGEESVHLTLWSKEEPAIPIWPNPMALFHRLFGTHEDLRILSDMQKVRDIVSLALEARMKEGIKVRQPLKELRIRKQELRIKDNEQLVGLIKDEVNVKEVIFGVRIENDIELDTKITEDLKKEGQLREFVRYIQDLRKKEGLFPSQKVNLIVYTGETGKAFIGMFEQEFKNSVSVNDISFGATEGERIKVGDLEFIVKIN